MFAKVLKTLSLLYDKIQLSVMFDKLPKRRRCLLIMILRFLLNNYIPSCERKGLVIISSPIVVAGPWPG